MAQAISDELVEILACPRCRGRVKLSQNGAGLVCEACRLLYEIRDGIPVMLVEEARNMDEKQGPARV
ncbi:MAG: Trm112 family protein [Deltaproteobacteria bacterium]